MPPLHVLLEDRAIHCFALFKRPPNLSDASSGSDQCCAECQTNQLHSLCLASFSKTIQAKQRTGCPKCALSFVVIPSSEKASTTTAFTSSSTSCRRAATKQSCRGPW